MYLRVCGLRPHRHASAIKKYILQQRNAAAFAEAETCREQMRKKNVADITEDTKPQNIWKQEVRQIDKTKHKHTKPLGGPSEFTKIS